MDDSQPTPKNEMKTSENIITALLVLEEIEKRKEGKNKTKVKEKTNLETKERKPILSSKARQDLDRIFMM